MPDITIPGADGDAIPAYIVMPTVLPAPALVIVAAIMGVDETTARMGQPLCGGRLHHART